MSKAVTLTRPIRFKLVRVTWSIFEAVTIQKISGQILEIFTKSLGGKLIDTNSKVHVRLRMFYRSANITSK